MKGYLDNEEATKNTLTQDGWLHTGDIAYYDKDNFFYIVDRLKELIKVKGFQVPPAELEDLLRRHSQVADVAVIGNLNPNGCQCPNHDLGDCFSGIPHDKFGEVPRAYIVKGDPDVSEDVLHEFVNKEVSEYKRLRGGIHFMEQIPKSPSGKILRRQLVELHKQGKA